MQTANGSAIAGGAIVACLIDMLVLKRVLERSEVAVLLDNALQRLAALGITPDTAAAARETIGFIAQMYPNRGG